ncbi:MAG: hypothetical protein IPQ23_21430 [Cytophagaceae bacterium]|nr:hypothetical protein [Cytophagaceae bacterium]
MVTLLAVRRILIYRDTSILMWRFTWPVARILGNAQPDRFIDSKGNIFPVSPHFSPNVLLISGDFLRQEDI